MIEHYLKQLQDTWGYTTEELFDIQSKMAEYALCCCVDSAVMQEAFKLSGETNKN
jgi:hypothetical protein